MSEEGNRSIGCGGSLWGIWLLMFIIVKVGSTQHQFADWSWWWLLLPIVPDLVLILRKLGLL